MRILLLYFVLATTALLTPKSVAAQLGYKTYSIEWLTGASDVIVLAKIDSIEVDGLPLAVDAETPFTDANATIRIRIVDRMKGDPEDKLDFIVRTGVARQTLLPWKISGTTLILFLKKSDEEKPGYEPLGDLIVGDSAIAVGSSMDDKVTRPVLTSSLVLLDTAKEILTAIENLSRNDNLKRMTKSKQMPIPYDIALQTGPAGDANVLIVPDE